MKLAHYSVVTKSLRPAHSYRMILWEPPLKYSPDQGTEMRRQIFFVAALITLAGCATADRIHGVVLPMGDDVFQIINVNSGSYAKIDGVKAALHDAQLTCKNEGKESFTIITQDEKFTEKEYFDTGSKTVNALGIFIDSSAMVKKDQTYEITTHFSCH